MPHASLAILIAGTILGIAGIDLVLPAVPGLPEVFDTSPERAQLVLSAFAAGSAAGLLFFGFASERLEQRNLLAASSGAYGLISLGCMFAPNVESLIALRFIQGATGAAAAVFAPGILRALLPPAEAMRAIGLMGSIESLAPALAPLAGVYLLMLGGWQTSFVVIGSLSLVLTAVLLGVGRRLLPQSNSRLAGSYAALLRNPTFIRHALSHACALGGLLTFVFGAPTVLVRSMHGTLNDFIILQISGITAFATAANLTHRFVVRFTAERVILAGTLAMLASSLAIVIYALSGGQTPWVIIPFWFIFNFGFGTRGPPGFFRAVESAGGDDARGSALVVLGLLGIAAIGSAVVAPFIAHGLIAIGVAAFVSSLLALLLAFFGGQKKRFGAPEFLS